MPFGSLEQAKLYLKAAETMLEGTCGIYELVYSRGDKRYRVFKSPDELKSFLKRSPKIRCDNLDPAYISPEYHPVLNNQVRHLTRDEVQKYLNERKALGIK